MRSIGTKVIVRFPDGQEINGRLRADAVETLAHQVTPIPEDDQGGFMTVPGAWVHPVTPPCPWTDDNTVVMGTKSEDQHLLFRLWEGRWCVVGGGVCDWSRVAASNPVRLIPEPPPQPLLKDRSGDIWRLADTTEHWAGPHGKRVTRGQLEGTWGPLTEVPSS